MKLVLVFPLLLFFSLTFGLRRSPFGMERHPVLLFLQPQTDAKRTSGPVEQGESSATTTSSASITDAWSLVTAGTSDTGQNSSLDGLWNPDPVLIMTTNALLAKQRVPRAFKKNRSLADTTYSGSFFTISYKKYLVSLESGDCTCTYIIQGRVQRVTSNINENFSFPCSQGSTSYHYELDNSRLLAGNDDYVYFVYADISNTNQLLVIENGNCKIITYTEDPHGDIEIEYVQNTYLTDATPKHTSGTIERKTTNLDSVTCKKMTEELKNILQCLLTQCHTDFSTKKNELANMVKNPPKVVTKSFPSLNYILEHKSEQKDEGWTETFDIRGTPSSATRNIQDTFNPEYQEARFIHLTNDEVFVGCSDQNFLLYGNMDNPDQLIEMQDGKCKINTYTPKGGDESGETTNKDEVLDEGRCSKVSALLKNVEDRLKNNQNSLADFKKDRKQLNDLLNRFTKGEAEKLEDTRYLVEFTTVEKDIGCSVTMKVNERSTPSMILIEETYKRDCKEDMYKKKFDDVLLFSPDGNVFLLYSYVNNPDKLIEFDFTTLTCNLKTYTPNGLGKFSVQTQKLEKGNRRHGKIIKPLGNTILTILDEKDYKDSYKKLDRLIKTFTNGLSESLIGENYVVDYKSKDDENTCTETINIRGNKRKATKLILDTFSPGCKEERFIHYKQDTLFVGGTKQNFLLYGHLDNPNQLIVKDETCKIITYISNDQGLSSEGTKNHEVLDQGRCAKILGLIKNVEDRLLDNKDNDADLKEEQKQLNELVNKFTKGIAESLDDTRYLVEFTTAEKDIGCSVTMKVNERSTPSMILIEETYKRDCKKDMYKKKFDDVLLFSPDDNVFLLYSYANNPDKLIELDFSTIICNIKTYMPNGLEKPSVETQNLKKGNRRFGIIINPLRDTILNILDQNDYKDSYRKLDRLIKTFTDGLSERLTGTNYDVEYKKKDEENACTETIGIRGIEEVPTKFILDTFSPGCKEERFIHYKQDTLFVGGTKQNFLLYGHLDNPNQLIVKDETCKIITYISNDQGLSSEGTKNHEVLDQGRCAKILGLITNVEDRLLDNKDNDADLKEKQKQLNELVNKFTKGIAESLDDTRYLVEFTTVEKDIGCSVTIKVNERSTPSMILIEDTYKRDCDKDMYKKKFNDVLLFSPDGNVYLLYSYVHNPDKLIEFDFNTCNIKTYSPNGLDKPSGQSQSQTEKIEEGRYKKIFDPLKNTITEIKGDKNYQDSYKKLDRLIKTFTNGLSESLTGKNYDVVYKKKENAQKCTETIDVSGKENAATKPIRDSFRPDCGEDRLFYYDQEVLFVGGTEQNYLLCGNLENPNQLIEVKNKKCKIKTYPSNGEDEENLDEGRYSKISGLLKNIEDHLVNNQDSVDGFNDKQKQLNLWVKKFTKGLTESGQSSNFIVDFNTKEKSSGKCTVSFKINGPPTDPMNYTEGTFTMEC